MPKEAQDPCTKLQNIKIKRLSFLVSYIWNVQPESIKPNHLNLYSNIDQNLFQTKMQQLDVLCWSHLFNQFSIWGGATTLMITETSTHMFS